MTVLQELALNAEVTRARTQLVTQPVTKSSHSGAEALSAGALFFDSESRNLQSADTQTQHMEQAEALGLLTKLCDEVNRLRTHHFQDHGRPASSLIPPEVPPAVFTIPERQQLVPNPRAPEARTDLESLLRYANDATCAALGVPASIIVRPQITPRDERR